jgi:hypothetical protein
MNIRVHIERLVIDTGLLPDRQALEAAVTEGLSQALRDQPALPLLRYGATIPALNGGTVQFHGPASLWGEQFGRSVHAALASGMQGPGAPTRGPR